LSNAVTQSGDLVLLITGDQKRYLVKLRPNDALHTHQGIFPHQQLIGITLGATVFSTMQQPALMMAPSLRDLIQQVRRGTQIIYPKDAAYLVHRLSLRAGSRVIEAGTGSGGLTIALAWVVAPSGMVYSYEMRPEIHNLARNNLERVGLLPHVQMFNRNIEFGFDQTGVDALFLDVREPWNYLHHVRAALRCDGFFASLVPTTNQVSELLLALENNAFADIEVEELLLRRYKPVPDRLRPDDMMNGHTGYLVFARRIDASSESRRWLATERQRYMARQQAEERIAAEEQRRTAERAQGEGKKYPKLPLPG
jgi:tRNA (adenine57-N1/adenine58-N1)-methyltransferase